MLRCLTKPIKLLKSVFHFDAMHHAVFSLPLHCVDAFLDICWSVSRSDRLLCAIAGLRKEQQSLIQSRTQQLQRDLNLREKELATAKKDLAAAESESRAARMEAERVRVLTDERDAAVADLTRQLVRESRLVDCIFAPVQSCLLLAVFSCGAHPSF